MRKSDVTCPKCNAGYRRIELVSKQGPTGEFRCVLCDRLLEVFDGKTEIALRLTVQPERILSDGAIRFRADARGPGPPFASGRLNTADKSAYGAHSGKLY
jgi:hypothetical protein